MPRRYCNSPALAGLAICLVVSLASCGGGGSTPTTGPQAGSVTISFTGSATVPQGGALILTAAVAGSSNSTVTWSIQEGSAGGNISPQGVYTAPTTPGTYHVIATSVADPSKTATLTITVPAVTISVSPATVPSPVPQGATLTLTPTVSGTVNVAVNWSIQEGGAGGTISATGVYTAPNTPGTYHIVATSVADTTKTAVVAVTVPPVSVAVSPPSIYPTQGSTNSLIATVSGTINIAVTWSILEGVAGGSISSSGTYTAPLSFGTFHAVATSVADPTKSATVTIFVPDVSVYVDPSELSMGKAEVFTFQAYIYGCFSSVPTWTIDEGGAGGSITSGGVYTAPANFGTYHVRLATACAKSTTAAVTVEPLSVSVIPASDMLGPVSHRQFAAKVVGSVNTLVSWTLQEGSAAGTITQDGHYTSPASTGVFHVVAAAAKNPSVTGSGTVTAVTSGFKSGGSMYDYRSQHAATVLDSGKVLVTGGNSCLYYYYYYYSGGSCFLNTAEIYDPATDVFTRAAAMTKARSDHTATLLTNGRVLVAGGGTNTAELYDPSTAIFAATGSLTTNRSGHTATRLTNGRVLLTGGYGPSGTVASAEEYDPTLGTFSFVANMASPRFGHTATPLSNGKILIVGGWTSSSNGSTALKSAELYDPATKTFTTTGSMSSNRADHTATVLASGNVLITGGDDGTGAVASAEIYDAATGQFTSTATPMLAARRTHVALVVGSKVLIAGGMEPGVGDYVAEIFDPAFGTFSQTGSLERGRRTAAAVVLGDGRVLIVGGTDLNSTEVYK